MADLFDDLDQKRTATGGDVFADLDPPAPPPKTRGWGEAAWDTAKAVGSTADDAVRAVADTLTFGLLDRALGEDEIKKTLQARERSPYATLAGDVAGAVATPGLGVAGGAISRGLGGARSGVLPALARSAGYGVEGAVYGGLQGAGHTYDFKDLPQNVGTGAAFGGIGGAITGPLARVGAQPRAATPTTAELFERGTQQYDQLHPQGWPSTQYTPPSFFSTIDNVQQRLIRGGINAEDAPAAFKALDLARSGQGHAGVSLDPSNMAAIWRRLSEAQSAGGAEARAAYAIKREIEGFMANPANISYGTRAAAADAANTLGTANANWAAGSRSKLVEDANTRAVRGSAAAHSGLNYENTARQQIKNILNTKGADPLMGYTPRERQAVEDLVRRSTLPEYTRQAGNMLGGGGGLGAVVAGGVAGGAGLAGGQDPQTAAALALAGMGAGRGLRNLGNRSMAREIDEATRVLRQRSPLFLERQAATPGTMAGPGHGYTPTRQTIEGMKNAIVLELMRQQRPERTRITVHPNQR